MEKLYAVQWLSHSGKWQVCQGFDFDGQDIPVVHFDKDVA